jgi:DNA-directed RNA polymerase specialized sigma24 family protein
VVTAWSPNEALAVARLRQWGAERISLVTGKTTNYQRHGWQKRNARSADSKIVRVIAFAEALATLDPDEQAALVLTYRDRERLAAVALALGCSARKVGYLVPAARRKLADELDRRNLL